MTDTLTVTDPDYRLEYTIGAESWYSRQLAAHGIPAALTDPPGIGISKAHHQGGCAWEFTIVDMTARLGGQPGIQVRMFNDSFPAFTELAPLFAALAAEQPNTLNEVRDILDRLGIVDATVRDDPNPAAKAATAARLRREAARLTARADEIEGQTAR